MKAIGPTSNQQPLQPSGKGSYVAKVPIVVEAVDALTGWTIDAIEVWKRNVLRLTLRCYVPNWGEEQVICFCPADILRVARETHVL